MVTVFIKIAVKSILSKNCIIKAVKINMKTIHIAMKMTIKLHVLQFWSICPSVSEHSK